MERATSLLIAGCIFFSHGIQGALADTVTGFTEQFAPDKWAIGSNPPNPVLVSTNGANGPVVLSNYSDWQVSGSAFSYPRFTSDGTVKFSYITKDTTTACPAGYSVGGAVTLLPDHPGPTPKDVSVAVRTGQSFAFILNGQGQPNNRGQTTV